MCCDQFQRYPKGAQCGSGQDFYGCQPHAWHAGYTSPFCLCSIAHSAYAACMPHTCSPPSQKPAPPFTLSALCIWSWVAYCSPCLPHVILTKNHWVWSMFQTHYLHTLFTLIWSPIHRRFACLITNPHFEHRSHVACIEKKVQTNRLEDYLDKSTVGLQPN